MSAFLKMLSTALYIQLISSLSSVWEHSVATLRLYQQRLKIRFQRRVMGKRFI